MEEKTAKKVMLSGIQPSGDLTLGSYLGAIKNWSERAEIFDCYYFMADLHSITVRQNPADLRRRTVEQLAQHIWNTRWARYTGMTRKRTRSLSRAISPRTRSSAGCSTATPCSASSRA